MTVTAVGLGSYNGPAKYPEHYNVRGVYVGRAPLSTDTLEVGVLWVDATNGNLYLNIGTYAVPSWIKFTGAAYSVLS